MSQKPAEVKVSVHVIVLRNQVIEKQVIGEPENVSSKNRCYNGKRLRNASGTSGMNVSYPLKKLGTVRKDRKKGQLT